MCLNKFFCISIWVLISLHAKWIKSQIISYTLNLKEINDDRLTVRAKINLISSDSIWFCFPAVVPGTYDKYDFGKYISNLIITDEQKSNIPYRRYNENIYAFKTNVPVYITYFVDDTWDNKEKKKQVFEPAGTNFEKDKNFVLNHHGVFGYIYKHEDKPIKITVYKPEGFYPITGLQRISVNRFSDTLYPSSYHELVDSPTMYCLPDTLKIKVDNMDVWIGCYSPNKKINSKFIARTISEILYAQRDYLGGKLPVDKYAFIFYFHDKPPLSGSTGALEHNNSSMYSLLESDTSYLVQTLRDVCAHEFFHVVTPLTLHSEEIGNFDYLFPKMSKHLWLYEGLTEYSSHHSQLLAGIIDIDEFLSVMIEKLENSRNHFNDKLSFTEMSKNVLLPEMNKEYTNVYEKGALINMCLDLLLLHLSDGKYDMRKLVSDLGKRYGKNKSFKDDMLFDEITQLTYPEVRGFFRKYVENGNPLPFAECLKYAGIIYQDSTYIKGFTLGSFDMEYNPMTNRFFVSDITRLDAFGKALGIRQYDELYALNGSYFSASTMDVEIIQNFYKNLKEGDLVTLEVMRPKNSKRNKFKHVKLKAKAMKVDILKRNVLRLDENINDRQKRVLEKWSGITFR
ncbi:MAG: peptidase M61 [Bacteroidia bacterium]|nr:peptidase M61 [Bacteroidia bacterium]